MSIDRAIVALERAAEAMAKFVDGMRYLTTSQAVMERRQKRIHGVAMMLLVPLSLAAVQAINYIDLLLMPRGDVFHYESTETEFKVYPLGVAPRVYSTREWVWRGEIATEFDEHLVCDTNGNQSFSLFSSRIKPLGRKQIGPRPMERVGPWPTEFWRYPGRPMSCCIQSDIDARVSRLGLTVTKHQTINAHCDDENIFRYVETVG